MKTPLAILAVCLLVACASAPVVQPVHEDGTEVGAATAKDFRHPVDWLRRPAID